MGAGRSGSAGATSDDVNGKDGTVEAIRPVASAYSGNRYELYGRRPTPWPGMIPDPQSIERTERLYTAAHGTHSSEEGDVFEPLPAPRKFFSRLSCRKAPRSAGQVRIAAPRPAPQEHLSGSSSRWDVRPDAEMMDSLAALVGADATQSLGDADIAPPPTPPRSPLRLTSSASDTNNAGRVRDRILASAAERRQSSTVMFAPGTNTQPGPSSKKKKGRFDSLKPISGHYVRCGRKLSSDCSNSPEPSRFASEGSEAVSDSLHESVRSNPGTRALNAMRHFTGNATKRPSMVSLEPNSQIRTRDGSRPTTGTDEANAGTAALGVLNMYPGNPTRSLARRSITAVPKVPDDLGVLPETSVDDDGRLGPATSRPAGIEEEEEEKELDDERSPTDTRAPQLPLPDTLAISQPDAVSQDFALNNW